MPKNDIKLRKQLIDADMLQRHRNYSLLLQQHQRAKHFKRVKQFFIYSLLVAVVVILLLLLVSYFLIGLERAREHKKEGVKTSMLSKHKTKNNPYPVSFQATVHS